MLHEDIRGIAKALNEHKNRVADHDGDTWKLLHNAAANLDGLADSAEQLEAHFVSKDDAPVSFTEIAGRAIQ